MEVMFTKNLIGSFRPPPLSDMRWRIFMLLFFYLILGMTMLGFSRKPLHILLLIGGGALLDLVLNLLIRKRKIFPLSAMISCCSMAIILNWSFDIYNLFLPLFVCITSKYIFTLRGKHFFNPSLFAIVFCIVLGNEYITLSPSYQWYGSAQSAWFMLYFMMTGAFLLFVFKINRGWLIISFLTVFLLQTAVRAYIMQHIIPFETLFVGALTSPAFYLFTFFMITDPATSPPTKSQQIIVGTSIALLDFLFHMKFSLYTFFFAGMTVATVRFIYFHSKIYYEQWKNGEFEIIQPNLKKYLILFLFAIPVFWSFRHNNHSALSSQELDMRLVPVSEQHSGLTGVNGHVLEATDPAIQHIAKWILSVGDAAAVADVNMDGLPDLFMTQPLKSIDSRGKLYLNKGDLAFEKVVIPDLERYLTDFKAHGVPGFAYFLDYDNDGDKDLFIGFGFGKSHLFENRIIPDKKLSFKEVIVPFLKEQNTICLAANSFDYNNDGRLDMILTNTLHQYLPEYKDRKQPLNIFNLPDPEFDGDRRMFHFMHESWHNANNGGKNYLLLNTADSSAFKVVDESISGLKETRWSLAVATLDMNNDGYTDIFIANDFGKDDWYLNEHGKSLVRQQGTFFGDIGLDTYKGMNASAGDLDGNGKEDIYISNVHHEMQAEGSLLWMNETGDGAKVVDFKERAQRYNLLNTNRFGWGAAMGDLDLNGWTDVVQANGMVDDIWDKKWDKAQNFWYYQAQIARTGPEIHSYADKWADIRGCYIYANEPDRISLNIGGKNFVDAAEALHFDHKANTRGVILADFDNDGDLDILMTNQFGAPFFYKNEVKNKSWIGVKLNGNGVSTNKDAVGTKVWLTYMANGKKVTQYKEVRLVNGFSAMGDTRLLFGMGDRKNKLSDVVLKIRWHNGKEEVITIPKLEQYLEINQK